MSTINDGDPAFPWSPDGPNYQKYSGITIRDYFAAQCMAGILMNYTTEKYGATEKTVGKYAYRYADAMLKARENKE